MAEKKQAYPAGLNIDYPKEADRLTAFFRIFTVIPIAIILSLLLGGQQNSSMMQNNHAWIYGGGFIFIPTLLMILFQKKYPKWWFEWNVALTKFMARVFSYLLLLTHEYPSTDEEQSVHIKIKYPNGNKDLGRGMPLIKWLLSIPHWIVLCLLYYAVAFVTIIAWFAILFIGQYPKGMFDFVVGVMRWSLRVDAYAFLLITDEYPPFQLNE